MVESNLVLAGQTVIYTVYVLAILLLMGWFALRITRPAEATPVRPGLFYGFVGFLVVVGVSLHLVTYHTIPWVQLDLERGAVAADRTFDIQAGGQRFLLPEGGMEARCGERVLFRVSSGDLTYGFGLFREDNSMVCQMQVVPGHVNELLWVFDQPGIYQLRSTEYSGPAGVEMVVPEALRVSCDDTTGR